MIPLSCHPFISLTFMFLQFSLYKVSRMGFFLMLFCWYLNQLFSVELLEVTKKACIFGTVIAVLGTTPHFNTFVITFQVLSNGLPEVTWEFDTCYWTVAPTSLSPIDGWWSSFILPPFDALQFGWQQELIWWLIFPLCSTLSPSLILHWSQSILMTQFNYLITTFINLY